VRKFEPVPFPFPYWRQKIRFEKEQSGNCDEKSGNHRLVAFRNQPSRFGAWRLFVLLSKSFDTV
jgi:hypothetical protein